MPDLKVHNLSIHYGFNFIPATFSIRFTECFINFLSPLRQIYAAMLLFDDPFNCYVC